MNTTDKKNEIELLWNISESLVSSRVLNEVLHLIVTATAELMQTKICSIMLLDEATGELKIAATQALSKAYYNKGPVHIGVSVSGRALKEGKPIVVPNVLEDPQYGFPELAKKENLISMVSVPLPYKDSVIGVINCYSKSERVFTPHEIRTLQSVANQAAIAIENTRLEREADQAKRALEDRRLVDQAKSYLMEKNGLSEKEAYQLLHKTSRDNRMSMASVAESILLVNRMNQQTAS